MQFVEHFIEGRDEAFAFGDTERYVRGHKNSVHDGIAADVQGKFFLKNVMKRMRVIGIRQTIQNDETILREQFFFGIIEVQMVVDSLEIFGFFLAIPRICRFDGRGIGNVGPFFIGANMLIADETSIGAFGSDIDRIAIDILCFVITTTIECKKRFCSFVR